MKKIIYSSTKEGLKLFEPTKEDKKIIDEKIKSIDETNKDEVVSELYRYISLNMTNLADKSELNKDSTFNQIDKFLSRTIERKNFSSEIVLYIQELYKYEINEELIKLNDVNNYLKLVELNKGKNEMIESINTIIKKSGSDVTIQEMLEKLKSVK